MSRRAHWAAENTVISRLMAEALARPELISLAAGFVDTTTLPVEPLRIAFDALWSDSVRCRAALQYGTTIGHTPLRDAILQRMLMSDRQAGNPHKPSIEQVVLTAGSNQILELVADTLLDPGDIVLTSAPSYFVYLSTLNGMGARTVGVAMDRDGMIPEALDEQFARFRASGELSKVKAVYVTSYFDNPCGVSTPVERRHAILEIVRKWSQENFIYILEDAAYRELRYFGEDVPSLYSLAWDGLTNKSSASGIAEERVVYAGTFSKSFSPGVRIGWGVLPKSLVGPVLAQKGNLDFGSPHLNQVLMALVMETGLFDKNLKTVCDQYRSKLSATLAGIDAYLVPLGCSPWTRPGGGLYVWLQLPEHVDATLHGSLFGHALEQGMMFVPGDCCFPNEGHAAPKNVLRLSFGVPSIEQIGQGLLLLAEAVRRVA
jgi:2-aminoadipate transaminase